MKKKPQAIKPSQPPRSRRHENWPSRLHDFIESRRERPFAWGRQDCCLLACDAIRAIIGKDPARGLFRGKYKDALGAARILKKHGGVERIAIKVCQAMGFARVKVPFARRGDVLLYKTERGPALGICDGPHGVFPGPTGLQFIPVASCRRAWRVD